MVKCPDNLQTPSACAPNLTSGAWWGQYTGYTILPANLDADIYDTLIISYAALGRTELTQNSLECRIQPNEIQVLDNTGRSGVLLSYPNSFVNSFEDPNSSQTWLRDQIKQFKLNRTDLPRRKVLLSFADGQTVEKLSTLFRDKQMEQPYALWCYGRFSGGELISGLANIVHRYISSLDIDGIDIDYEQLDDIGDPDGDEAQKTIFYNWELFLGGLKDLGVHIQVSPPGSYSFVKAYAKLNAKGLFNVIAPQLYNNSPGNVFSGAPLDNPNYLFVNVHDWFAETPCAWVLYGRSLQNANEYEKLDTVPQWFSYLFWVSNTHGIELPRMAVAVPSNGGVSGAQPCWDYGELATWMSRLSILYNQPLAKDVFCDPRERNPYQYCPDGTRCQNLSLIHI